MTQAILVTGGAGFIGSSFVLEWVQAGGSVLNLDLLTYAGSSANLASLAGNPRHCFVRGDIGDRALVASLLREHRPRAIVHLAAETHVDRSIEAPDAFIRVNVDGTFALLEEARHYWSALDATERRDFRFLHVSTDEVYGSRGMDDPPAAEGDAYAPNSPYAASKAAADHLARAYFQTWGLPVLLTNCSNNFGPRQFPEKLIPLMILHALAGKRLPVYGDGSNRRDWLHVTDHCAALRRVLAEGRPGERYNIGGGQERANLDVVRAICALVDELCPDAALAPRERLITLVADRPGHDWRYSLDSTKIRGELGWTPAVGFEKGLRATVAWYVAHREWANEVRASAYGSRAELPAL